MPVSKFHKLLEMYEFDERIPGAREVLDTMQRTPKFVFSEDVQNFIDDHFADYADAFHVAIKAGRTELPHNPMVVEWSVQSNYRCNRMFWLVNHQQGGVFGGLYALQLGLIIEDRWAVYDGFFPIRITSDGFCEQHDYSHVPPGVEADTTEEKFSPSKHFKGQAYVALFYAMALHVRGIVTRPPRLVDPKLDRARLKRHLPPITKNYVTVHIGYVTDRLGQRHDYVEGLSGHVRVHLRRGHYRNQACGTGRLEHHEIWIPTTLVNYRPGIAVPTPDYLVLP